MICTRPDISHVVIMVMASRYRHNLRNLHNLRSLTQTIGFVDSDYAGDLNKH